jgi:hypothetical protein
MSDAGNSNPMNPAQCRAWSTVTFVSMAEFWAALDAAYKRGEQPIAIPRTLEIIQSDDEEDDVSPPLPHPQANNLCKPVDSLPSINTP